MNDLLYLLISLGLFAATVGVVLLLAKLDSRGKAGRA